jgi:hypothetical protein
MATNGVDFSEIRVSPAQIPSALCKGAADASVGPGQRRVIALRKPDLHECLERLGMRKGGNKPELQQRLLEIFEDSCNL